MRMLYYAIQLEDYSMAKVAMFPKTFYGTMSNIYALIRRLSADPVASLKYQGTIRAFHSYEKGNYSVTHTIAGKTERLLTPVDCIHNTMILQENAEWHFYNGAFDLNLRADFVTIHQVLLRQEDMYLRCARSRFENLQVEDATGWKAVPNCHHGFPHICDISNGSFCLRLYTLEQVENRAEPCVEQMNDARYVSHHDACDEIFGG